jgi:flagella basal body P-ring formation protein FlgA
MPGLLRQTRQNAEVEMGYKVLSLFPVIFMLNVWQAHADDAWIANRTIQPGDMVQATDIDVGKIDSPPSALFATSRSPAGMDARRRILSGHPIFDRDVERHMLGNPAQSAWNWKGAHCKRERWGTRSAF